VGEESRKYFWILCREPVMRDELYNAILQRATEQHGYDLSTLIKTVQT
jgi:lipocalin